MTAAPDALKPGTLTELTSLLADAGTFEELMQQVADLASRTVPGARTCGITIAQGGRAVTVASADALARQLDEQQYELDQGPCLEALDSGLMVSSDDLGHEQRWGGYPSRALRHGVRSVYADPLLVQDRPVGAINLYGDGPGALDLAAQSVLEMFAGLAAATITAALRHYDEATLTDNLRAALSSRSVIDQAIGIVMANERCGPEVAFGVLRAASQKRNAPLREVASELVAVTGRSAGRPA